MKRYERSTSLDRCVGLAMQALAVVVPLLLLLPQRADAAPSVHRAPVVVNASTS